MNLKIFLSYRRSDTDAYSGWIAEHLSSRYGSEAVFDDVISLAPGVNFPREIAHAIQGASILLLLIGREWNPLNPETNRGRLFDADDWVRREVVTAFESHIGVLPVLVDGVSMPTRESLPNDLAPLLSLNATRLSRATFKVDMAAIMKAIDTRRVTSESQTPTSEADDPQTRDRFKEIDRLARASVSSISNYELWRETFERVGSILSPDEQIVVVAFARTASTDLRMGLALATSNLTWVTVGTDRRIVASSWAINTVIVVLCSDFVAVRRKSGVLQHEVYLTAADQTISFFFKKAMGAPAAQLADYIEQRLAL